MPEHKNYIIRTLRKYWQAGQKLDYLFEDTGPQQSSSPRPLMIIFIKLYFLFWKLILDCANKSVLEFGQPKRWLKVHN